MGHGHTLTVHAAQALGLTRASGEAALGDEWLTALLASLRTQAGRPRGDAWERCQAHRDRIKQLLGQGLRLSKLRKLLLRQGVLVPYATLHRFAVAELGFGRTAATVPIADCAPGEELQVDTGWMGYLEPDALGKRRRFRAWIFTAVYSRHRFVWPCLHETTATAIQACEQAWQFFGGIFRVLLPDSNLICCRRPRRFMRSLTGATRRSDAITWRKSPRRSTHSPRALSASTCAPAPIAPSCASTIRASS